MALPGLELTTLNDNKTARGTRQTRWSLSTLTAAWATSTDQRREARVPKTSAFEASDQFTQAGLTESRKAEWAKWKQFNAVYPVSGSELEQLLAQGHKPIPLQWLEIDKNEHKRREGGPLVAPRISFWVALMRLLYLQASVLVGGRLRSSAPLFPSLCGLLSGLTLPVFGSSSCSGCLGCV